MFIPFACVFAQSIWQFTPPSHPKKNMHTAPMSRVTFLHGNDVNGVSLSHGSEYAFAFPLLAEFRKLSTVSTRRQYGFEKFAVCALMIPAVGTVPLICSYAAWMKLFRLFPKFTSTCPLAPTGNVTSGRVVNDTFGSHVHAAAKGADDARPMARALSNTGKVHRRRTQYPQKMDQTWIRAVFDVVLETKTPWKIPDFPAVSIFS